MPTWSWMRLSSICISLRSFRSSAPSGSSRSSTRGFMTSARASATRCCWPPESMVGRCFSRPVICTSSSASARLGVALGLADLALLEPVGDVVQHGHVREQGVLLEDGVDLALVGRHPDRVPAADEDLALVWLLEAGDHPQRRGLAAPGRPQERQELALAHPETDRVNRGQRTEALRHRAELYVVGAAAVWSRDQDHLLNTEHYRAPRGPAAGERGPPACCSRIEISLHFY